MKKSVKDIDVINKKVLLRVDFNVPLNEHGEITSDTQIRAAIPTIRYLMNNGCRIILCSHLGRPAGIRIKTLSMRVTAKRLSRLISQSVQLAPDCVGNAVEDMASHLRAGEIMMLENVRYHREEMENDETFSRSLSALAEVYINDAFGACHRTHASVVGVPHYLPSAAGFLLEKEVRTLGALLVRPEHKFAGLFGGVQLSDKTAALANILGKLDILLFGGAMAALFLKVKGYEIGQSRFETGQIDSARALLERINQQQLKLVLPADVVIADRAEKHAVMQTVSVDSIPREKTIVDIGPLTLRTFQENLADCRTVFWNGPMGVHEIPIFATGTRGIANYLADLNAITIVAGGSTAEMIDNLKLSGRMGFVSTGGGASLCFLAGEKLAGLEALPDKDSIKV